MVLVLASLRFAWLLPALAQERIEENLISIEIGSVRSVIATFQSNIP